MSESRCNFDTCFPAIKNIIDMIDPGDTVISCFDLLYEIPQQLIKIIRCVASFNNVLIRIHRIERHPACSCYSGFVRVLM